MKCKPEQSPAYSNIIHQVFSGFDTSRKLKPQIGTKSPPGLSNMLNRLNRLGLIRSKQEWYRRGSLTQYHVDLPGMAQYCWKCFLEPVNSAKLREVTDYTKGIERLLSAYLLGLQKRGDWDKGMHEILKELCFGIGLEIYRDREYSSALMEALPSLSAGIHAKLKSLEGKNTILHGLNGKEWAYYTLFKSRCLLFYERSQNENVLLASSTLWHSEAGTVEF